MSDNYVEKVMPLSAETATVLKDRLAILDQLSALRKANRKVHYYDVTPSKLHLTGGAVAASALFVWLRNRGIIAAFAPTEETDYVIWHNNPVRITSIDRKRLRQERKSTASELKQRHQVTHVPTVPKPSTDPRHGFWPVVRGFPTAIAAFIVSFVHWRFVERHWSKVSGFTKAVLALTGFLGSVAGIWTLVVSLHW